MVSGVSRLTAKFQVTIPKEVREAVGLKPGEEVLVEARGEEIVVKPFKSLEDPLKVLMSAKRRFDRPIPIEELEERIERR
jgi:AbrB family looped-hinge helix DNA binding protein